MPFTTNPISAEKAEENSYTPWVEGQYEFLINQATEKKSSKGNDMIELELTIYKGQGTRKIRSWLVFMDSMQWSVRHFYESIKKIAEYDSGIIDAQKLVGSRGVCFLKIDEYEKDGKVNMTNKVDGWVKPENVIENKASGTTAPKAKPVVEEEEEDDIPF